MAQAPLIDIRDGSGDTATEVVFTTNLESITLEGTIDNNTVAVQVSVNGAAFVSDNTLVDIDGTDFTFPNPDSYPDGFGLDLGVNSIRFRAIDILGSVSLVSSATITRVASDSSGETLIPTAVRIRRRRDAVDLLVAKPTIPLIDDGGTLAFRGFNFYASATEGGATGTGYIKVNNRPVTEESTVFEEDLLEIDANNVVFSLNEATTSTRVKLVEEDAFGNVLATPLDRVFNVSTVGRPLKFSQSLQIRDLTEFVYFRHNRRGGVNHINSDQFVDVTDAEPLYYVITGVYYDPATSTEFETPYSQEIVGSPLILDTAIKDLPGRNQLQIVLDFVAAVQRVNAEIALIPGSTTRDVSVDPFSSEAERLWFIADFVHRSQSFLTLLQIDDANNDGVSDSVASSAYKQALKAALGFKADSAVQTLIDTQFEKLAGNYQVPRLPGRPAVGQGVYYTRTRPSADITIGSGSIVSTDADNAQGLPAVRYLVGGTYVLVASDADAYFNFESQRYEVTVDITAETSGSVGNRGAGDIKNTVTSVNGLQFVNTEATVFGNDRESNHDLAVRSELAFVSLDTGTEGGYAKTAAGQIGVVKTKIVKSGDPLMMRDYDEVRGKHIGGKVDIYVQGLRERTVTERFAFTFAVARDIRCQIVDPVNLIFRVLDTRVTVSTPIVELLDNAVQGLGVRNGTLGQDYDLTGAVILTFDTFQLSTAVTQPATALDDVILADYRFRSDNIHTFLLQPVRRVTSVVGSESGALSPTQVQLYKVDDPLLEGESTIARDYLVVTQEGGLPTGNVVVVNDEQHVMIGFSEERLASIGVNTATIRVFNQDRSIEYDGPGSATPDFEIVEGTSTTPPIVKRTVLSDITSGQVVSIDYEHDENFTVTYVINDLLQQLQRTVNRQRHVTADVLVKQAQRNSANIETTVQLKLGASKDVTDPLIRTSVSTELNTKLIGQGSAVSDIINAVDSTSGVDYQVVPLARMGYADGSRKLRESVNSNAAPLSDLDLGGNSVFILTSALQYPTTNGGGLTTEHRGVFQDDVPMVLSDSLANVGLLANQAYIIGSDGATIIGYSDDATIILAGFTDPSDIVDERLRRTANHVVVSLSNSGSPPDAPENHKYSASYVVRNHRGPSDLTTSQIEHIDLGSLTVTYRNATL